MERSSFCAQSPMAAALLSLVLLALVAAGEETELQVSNSISSPGTAESKSNQIQSALPSQCYTPSGETCMWYSQCLEVIYPCKARGQQDYPLDFAQHYCLAFGNYTNSFTPMGLAWLNTVRKCLQLALVPLLNNSQATTMSCKNLTSVAFKSHYPCYTHPDPGNHSIDICSLPCSDLALITYVIWFRGKALINEFGLTVETMFNVGVECLTTRLACLHWNHSSYVNLVVSLPSMKLPSLLLQSSLGRSIARKMSSLFNLEQYGIVTVPKQTTVSLLPGNGAKAKLKLMLYSLKTLAHRFTSGSSWLGRRRRSLETLPSVERVAADITESLGSGGAHWRLEVPALERGGMNDINVHVTSS